MIQNIMLVQDRCPNLGPGKLVIWPSYLYHETQKNSSEERYTISFNTLDKSYLNAIRN